MMKPGRLWKSSGAKNISKLDALLAMRAEKRALEWIIKSETRKSSATAQDFSGLKFDWREQVHVTFFDGLRRLVVAGFCFQEMRMKERLSRRSRRKSHLMRLSSGGARWALARRLCVRRRESR
jgi:hypothetical protein